MNQVQLYINNERIDLFKDESIDIVNSIQDVRDISKVFTPFSFDFNVPASKNNNKIFKHYYNSDITNGFDARLKVAARIDLNYATFQEGYIELSSVKLKDNKPQSYKVGFIGNTLTLKELFGNDKLGALTSLNSSNLDYSAANIKSNLQNNRSSSDIITPLITHTDRLYYDSSITGGTDGNLYYTSPTQTQGVHWTELKYALRIDRIIRAIESKYSITFSNDFFVSTNKEYYDLYMWLHRNKGDFQATDQITKYYTGVDDFTNDSMTYASISDNETLVITDYTELLSYTLELNTVSAEVYSVNIYEDGILFSTTSNLTGNNTLDSVDMGNFTNASYTVEIVHTASIAFTKIEWFAETDTESITSDIQSSPFTVTATKTFIISQNLPEIPIETFLQGLFKMFNLTAYIESGEVVVKTLDSFYSSGTSYDISKYVDVSDSSIGRALPYKEINLKYKDTESFFAAYHEKLFGYQWGTEEYNDDTDNFVGGSYDVEIPFSHMKYERLIDINTGNNTDIQWGWATDDSQNTWSGAPLVFYPIRLTASTSLAFRDSDTAASNMTTYNIPSNSMEILASTSAKNINFRLEVNEYTGDSTFTGTLFSEYYSTYIGDVFNITNRMYEFTAYLPLKIINKLRLEDSLIINNKEYRINKIKINLQTGKSKLELLNI